MLAYELDQLLSDQRHTVESYAEFLRVAALSVGLYTLPAGGIDLQTAHEQDEVYYVIGGQAMIRVEGEDRPIQAGSIVYVPAQADHHFHAIKESLTLLVFFAPAESSDEA